MGYGLWLTGGMGYENFDFFFFFVSSSPVTSYDDKPRYYTSNIYDEAVRYTHAITSKKTITAVRPVNVAAS